MTWDITWMPGPVAGMFFYLYLIVDIFSRKIVGWEVHEREAADLAATLIQKAVWVEACISRPLALHADNGSPMKGATMKVTLEKLGIAASYSHTGICSHCRTPRNFPDELMAEICARGGVTGIGYWQEVIGDTSPEGIAAAVVAAIELLGEDHVSLGSDFDGAAEEPFDTSELVVVTDALLKSQLPEETVAKVMGANMARLLDRLLPENG